MVYALQNWEGVADWDFIFVIVNGIKILPSFLSSSRLQLKPCYPRKDSSHSVLGLRSTLRSRESFNLSTLSSLAISAKPYQIGTTGVMSESLQAKKVEWSSSAFLSFLHLFALLPSILPRTKWRKQPHLSINQIFCGRYRSRLFAVGGYPRHVQRRSFHGTVRAGIFQVEPHAAPPKGYATCFRPWEPLVAGILIMLITRPMRPFDERNVLNEFR